MSTRSVVLGILAGLVARPSLADACTCATPAVQVFPGASEEAPLNSHVYLIVPLEAVGALDKVNFEVRPTLSREEEKARRKKQRKKKKRAAAAAAMPALEVDRRETASAAVGFVELTPKTALAAGTPYQVWMIIGDGKPAVVGGFTTGTARDDAAPTWAGMTGASWKTLPATPGTCQTGRAHVVLEHTPAKDGEGDRVLYGIWTAEPSAKIDYAIPPRAYAVDWNGRLALGPASTCVPSSVDLPAAGGLRLGVKAIDRAGNASAASEQKVAPPAPRLPAASIKGAK